MSEDPLKKETNINLVPAPYEKAVTTVAEKLTQAVIDAGSAFLNRVCLPGLEEFGAALKDRVSHWRRLQTLKLTQKWEAKMIETGNTGTIPPRLLEIGLDRGSIVDSDELMDKWAGLLASSCTEQGSDDSNLLFMTILDQLSIPQARIVDYGCEKAVKLFSKDGLVYVEAEIKVSVDELFQIAGVEDLQRLDRELDQLRTLDMIDGGFPLNETAAAFPDPLFARITPTPKALHFYIRCHGVSATPKEFFDGAK